MKYVEEDGYKYLGSFINNPHYLDFPTCQGGNRSWLTETAIRSATTIYWNHVPILNRLYLPRGKGERGLIGCEKKKKLAWQTKNSEEKLIIGVGQTKIFILC